MATARPSGPAARPPPAAPPRGTAGSLAKHTETASDPPIAVEELVDDDEDEDELSASPPPKSAAGLAGAPASLGDAEASPAGPVAEGDVAAVAARLHAPSAGEPVQQPWSAEYPRGAGSEVSQRISHDRAVLGAESILIAGHSRQQPGGVEMGACDAEDARVLISIAESASPAELAGFRRDAKVTARLNAAGLPRWHSFVPLGETRGALVTATPAGARADALASAMEPREALEVALAMCHAISEAHAAGVIHSRIQPGCVWVLPGRPNATTVTQWGWRHAAAACSTPAGEAVAALAPELRNGSPATEASDVYGIAASLLWLVTLADPPSPLAPAALESRGIPSEITPLLLEALDPDPHVRPRTAKAVAERLQRRLGETPAPAAAAPSVRAPAGLRAFASLVALAVGLAGVALAGAWAHQTLGVEALAPVAELPGLKRLVGGERP